MTLSERPHYQTLESDPSLSLSYGTVSLSLSVEARGMHGSFFFVHVFLCVCLLANLLVQ